MKNFKEFIGLVIVGAFVLSLGGIVGAKLVENSARNEYKEIAETYIQSLGDTETTVEDVMTKADEWIREFIK